LGDWRADLHRSPNQPTQERTRNKHPRGILIGTSADLIPPKVHFPQGSPSPHGRLAEAPPNPNLLQLRALPHRALTSPHGINCPGSLDRLATTYAQTLQQVQRFFQDYLPPRGKTEIAWSTSQDDRQTINPGGTDTAAQSDFHVSANFHGPFENHWRARFRKPSSPTRRRPDLTFPGRDDGPRQAAGRLAGLREAPPSPASASSGAPASRSGSTSSMMNEPHETFQGPQNPKPCGDTRQKS